MSLILTLVVIGLMAAVFLILTKPGHDRREKEFQDVLDEYIKYLDHAAKPTTHAARRKEARRPDAQEDVPADRD